MTKHETKYIVNGEERTVKEYHLCGVTICVYRKVKHCFDGRIKIDRDRFYGTGTTIRIYRKR